MGGLTANPNLSDEMAMQRHRMVERLRYHYRIADKRVLDAMERIPRHKFVPEAIKSQAYNDNALPISGGQTISQPYIVARMTELLELSATDNVLEIGSGSGYQTAVLAVIARMVFSIERIQILASEAKSRLMALGIRNFSLKVADGTEGWRVNGPYDAILVAAGGPKVPEPLIQQLVIGGRMVIPLGEDQKKQDLLRVTRTERSYETENFGPCAFVPLIGEHGW